ncbi:MAG: MoxR family ATPase [Chloroflexales bacterium]|nr:MoxR family ATPase [Chloroflexales bacterium]
MLSSIKETTEALAGEAYIADIGLCTSLFLALRMGKALLLEGEPGVGKTEVAKVLSRLFAAPLIRLQCYEGIDVAQAVYEWNYPRQLLELQARRDQADAAQAHTEGIYAEAFLLKRPLLQAIDAANTQAPVLLIDELDRADEEFESFLLELLSDFQITIPELGTLRARHRPIIIITSNRTRELLDALKRRCVYHWIDYPTPEKELEIVHRRLPGVGTRMAAQVVAFIQAARRQELAKPPGVAETLDWAEALTHLGASELSPQLVDATLGMILKYQDDVDTLRGALAGHILEELV